MRKERETKVFSKMERLYSKEIYLGEVRKFEKYNGLSKEIWERNKERRNMTDKKKKRKTEVLQSQELRVV